MFGSLLLYVLIAAPLVTAGAMMHPKGKAWVRKQHKRLRKRTWRVTKEAIGHKRDTPKRRANAAKRAARKQQPWGLLFRRKRPDGDPRLTTRLRTKAHVPRPTGDVRRRVTEAAASWWEHAQLWWINRDERRHERALTADQIHRRDLAYSKGLCGSTRTVDGHPCENPREIGKDRCQVHRSRLAGMKL